MQNDVYTLEQIKQVRQQFKKYGFNSIARCTVEQLHSKNGYLSPLEKEDVYYCS